MTSFTPTLQKRAAMLAEIASGAAHREGHGIDPREQVEMVRDSGLTALTLDPALGGPGGTIGDLVTFIIELAEADPIVAHILRSHYLQVRQISRLPDGPIRDRWAAELAAGKIFGNATSERDGALGTYQYATKLVSSGSGWLLSGAKFYSTGTAYADWVTVVAQLDEDQVVRVNLPLDRPGIEVLDDWDGIGQHRTGTGTTQFTDVWVTEDDFLNVTSPKVERIASDVPLMQLYLQAIMAGILRTVVSDASDLLRSRTRTFDHAPSQSPRRDPLLLETIGKLASTAYIAEAAVLSATSHIDAAYASERTGNPDPELFARASLAAAQVKVHVDEAGLSAASAIFNVGGASSASRAKNLDRHWRNIRTLTLHNPTSYKAVAIGDHVVNGTALPANGYF
ncbi:putative acyl-CoA dehydrogenase [Mycobacterium kiyosense]|uniref:acyl-CoA dehydrogenase family protein n=1 Tax=Mycobacterium TaxID=1763 RepID=UPI000A161BD9|nr:MULTISPECIES: acyl-CoA dehydrogenase family protein [Mycobacterium]MCV7007300.1 acyl-CoA dehydrogenase family protein [Mycobacterium gordonae]PJE24226.1 MAG: acyl-CoA dehydrogenase [Mycobacterium sp.]GLD42934.1 putative acyl-CoA dehydrogenase [Mycobacterium kiyosense]